ncbi:hypothetical protein Mycch_0112 [Mycolicibacterium chubuense NBB4]|uniref:Uncharacterized protein n=1 Tax=Mycolicibacterium chubuense (strain NBB4) TaxID=710421 RepID=I4BCD2_MYCCN|nr:hypothetical protein [Mycolicibacterium chubuense]AFM14939.1 hypothetical protein Mycch_0112 [Mycolicibacterium chubuense NBB4]
MVVERGLARCPRCVSVADYVFIEYGKNVIRYEVRCRKCGECYGEDMGPSAPSQLVVAEPLLRWPPDCEPVPPRDWGAELRGHLAVAAQHCATAAQISKTGFDEVAKRAHAMGEHTRTWVHERRRAYALGARMPLLALEGRGRRTEIQTGG